MMVDVDAAACGGGSLDSEPSSNDEARLSRMESDGAPMGSLNEAPNESRLRYADAKKSIWAELKPEFIATIPKHVRMETQSSDRNDYILHPESGERLTDTSIGRLRKLKTGHAGRFDVQIVISDGLNAPAISDKGHLAPFLERLLAGQPK